MKNRIKFLVAAAIALTGDLVAQVSAFVDVNVIAMTSERIRENQTVIVEDGEIKAIGPSSTTPAPRDARIINASGQYLMPGLADMHVHIWIESDLTLYLANGVTRVRNLNGRPFHLQWRQQIASGEKVGPTLYTSGPTMYGQLGVRNITTAEAGIEAVRQQKAMGYDFVKVYHLLPADVYTAVMKTAKEVNMPVVGHKPARVPWQTVINSGQQSVEHLLGYANAVEVDDSPLRTLVQQGQWSFRYSYAGIDADNEKIARAAKQAADGNLWNCPTLVVMDRWVPNASKEMEAIKAKYYWQYVPASRRNGSVERYGVDFDDYTLEHQRQGWKVRRQMVKALHEAKAGLLLGTDAGANTAVAGFSIHEELENLVEAGLTPYQALATGTSSVSQFLGTPKVGVIERGAVADLVLLGANPLKNIGSTRKIMGVMKNGRWYPIEDLQQKLADIAKSYAN